MIFCFSTILYFFISIAFFQLHWGAFIFLHFLPSLFFWGLSFKKKDFKNFLQPFGLLLLTIPFLNWGFLILFLSIPKKVESKIYSLSNQENLFKKYEHSILVRLAIKSKSN